MVRETSYSLSFTVWQQMVALWFITFQMIFDLATFCEAPKAFCAALRTTKAHFSILPNTPGGIDNHLALVSSTTAPPMTNK